jgi:hypothetical protein
MGRQQILPYSGRVWNSTRFLRVGYSPVTTIASTGTASFKGDIMFLALYNKTLTAADMQANYDAYLAANNAPVGPASSSAIPVVGREDQAAEVLPAAMDLIYDFDVNGAGRSWTSTNNTGNGQTLTKFVSDFKPTSGKNCSLLAGTKTISSFGAADSNYTALTFSSTSKDQYGAEFAIIKVKAVDSKGSVSSTEAVLQVNVAPTNDAPAGGAGVSFLVNQRVIKPLNLAVLDFDCSNPADSGLSFTGVNNASCDFGPSTVGIRISSTQQFGKIFVRSNATAPCTGSLTEVTATTANFSVSVTSPGSYSFVLPLCVEGCAPSNCPSNTNVPDG